MANKKSGNEQVDLNIETNKANDVDKATDANENKVTWTSHQVARKNNDRRVCSNRRNYISRGMTVPDLRGVVDRRSGEDRRKVKLTITGRAIDL